MPSTVEKKLLHYIGKAIADFNMIQTGDKVMVCLSGGKDSFAMLKLLHLLSQNTRKKFSVFSFTLNQKQPGWDDTKLRAWLENEKIEYAIVEKNTYSIVKEKVKPGKTFCGLCSRLRRGNIYGYALRNGFKKIALGHHRDDLLATLLMAIFYNGEIRSMPPKLITNDKNHIVLRPLVYCQEKDIIKYAKEQGFPIMPCGLCSSQENQMRDKMQELLVQLTQENPKVPSNMLHALKTIRKSHMMDKNFYDFNNLEKELLEN